MATNITAISDLLPILACPANGCHGKLELQDGWLICQRCELRYRIESGYPVLIPEEAEPPPPPTA